MPLYRTGWCSSFAWIMSLIVAQHASLLFAQQRLLADAGHSTHKEQGLPGRAPANTWVRNEHAEPRACAQDAPALRSLQVAHYWDARSTTSQAKPHTPES